MLKKSEIEKKKKNKEDTTAAKPGQPIDNEQQAKIQSDADSVNEVQPPRVLVIAQSNTTRHPGTSEVEAHVRPAQLAGFPKRTINEQLMSRTPKRGKTTGFIRADDGRTGNLARHRCGSGRERRSDDVDIDVPDQKNCVEPEKFESEFEPESDPEYNNLGTRSTRTSPCFDDKEPLKDIKSNHPQQHVDFYDYDNEEGFPKADISRRAYKKIPRIQAKCEPKFYKGRKAETPSVLRQRLQVFQNASSFPNQHITAFQVGNHKQILVLTLHAPTAEQSSFQPQQSEKVRVPTERKAAGAIKNSESCKKLVHYCAISDNGQRTSLSPCYRYWVKQHSDQQCFFRLVLRHTNNPGGAVQTWTPPATQLTQNHRLQPIDPDFKADSSGIQFKEEERHQPKRRKPPAQREEQLVVATNHVFQRVGIDLTGPLPVTAQGNRYYMNVICWFTKYVISIPLPDTRADTCARALLNHVVLKHGTMSELISDGASGFTSAAFEHFCSLLEIRHHTAIPHHSRGNGAAERTFRTFHNSMSKYRSHTTPPNETAKKGTPGPDQEVLGGIHADQLASSAGRPDASTASIERASNSSANVRNDGCAYPYKSKCAQNKCSTMRVASTTSTGSTCHQNIGKPRRNSIRTPEDTKEASEIPGLTSAQTSPTHREEFPSHQADTTVQTKLF
uniref:Integrase catalytic domain-containing protein n=1 Tax=Caenorhabditis japonica TaxID=281687 RepID=A0A8R1HNP6_CAEJA